MDKQRHNLTWVTMHRIVGWEKGRIWQKVGGIITVGVLASIISGVMLYSVQNEMAELGTWELVQYIGDEAQVIQTVWEEMPREQMVMSLGFVGMVVAVGAVIIQKSGMWKQRWHYLTKVDVDNKKKAHDSQ